VKGIIKEDSRQTYTGIMEKLQDRGAEGIILGCTEIGLLVKDFGGELFDSTPIHANKLVEAMLE
jgi:aspartate racemase